MRNASPPAASMRRNHTESVTGPPGSMAARRDVNASSRPSGLHRGADDVAGLAGEAPRRRRAVGGHDPDLALPPVLGLDDERAHERHVAAVGRQRGVADGLHPVVVGELDLTRRLAGRRRARSQERLLRRRGTVGESCAPRRNDAEVRSLPHVDAAQPRPTPIPGTGVRPRAQFVPSKKRRASAGQDALLRPRHGVGVLGRGGPPERPVRCRGARTRLHESSITVCAVRLPVGNGTCRPQACGCDVRVRLA